jgi:hypothetical protein
MISDRSGQAVVEYALALSLFVIIIAFGGSLIKMSRTSASDGLHAQTFKRAPYTISTSVGSSGQCFKDIILR